MVSLLFFISNSTKLHANKGHEHLRQDCLSDLGFPLSHADYKAADEALKVITF